MINTISQYDVQKAFYFEVKRDNCCYRKNQCICYALISSIKKYTLISTIEIKNALKLTMGGGGGGGGRGGWGLWEHEVGFVKATAGKKSKTLLCFCLWPICDWLKHFLRFGLVTAIS